MADMSLEEAIEICEDLVDGNKTMMFTTIHLWDKEMRAIYAVVEEYKRIKAELDKPKEMTAREFINLLKAECARQYPIKKCALRHSYCLQDRIKLPWSWDADELIVIAEQLKEAEK